MLATVKLFFPWLETNSSTLSLIKRYNQKVHVKKETLFITPGSMVDKIYCVSQGSLKYSILGDGGEKKVIGVITRGGIFGACPTFLQLPSSLAVEALEDSTLYYVTREQACQAMQTNPSFAVGIIQGIGYHVKALVEQVESLTFQSPRKRILQLLLAMSLRSPEQEGGWHKTPLKLTHQQIAEIIGVTRVTVTRLISTLKDEGLVKTVDREVYLSADFQARVERELSKLD